VVETFTSAKEGLMDPALVTLLQDQQRGGFPDFAGSEVNATIPVSERFVNTVVSRLLPTNGKIRGVQIKVEDGNQFTAQIQPSGPSFLPSIPVTVSIEDQPLLPDRPTLGLRLMKTSGVLALAGSLIPSLGTFLPPGVTLDGDRITIDIRRLLAERKLESWLAYFTDLRVNTRAGALVLSARLRV
jgi:hypothetical protein